MAGLPARESSPAIGLVNQRTAVLLADRVEMALTRRSRRRGLLGRDRLDPASALLLAPCMAVHTAFMQFAIDVVFLDRQWRVRQIVRRLPPWRLAASFGARVAIELPGGTVGTRMQIGDRLYLAPGPWRAPGGDENQGSAA